MLLLQDKCVVVVEDNMQNRIVFQIALVRHGAVAFFERRGKETLARLKNVPNADMILLDLMLADGISGFDIYDEIRSVSRFDSIPIVAVSAMESAVAIPQARSKGFSAFIAKPIDSYLFPKQLAAILAGEPVWDFGNRTLMNVHTNDDTRPNMGGR